MTYPKVVSRYSLCNWVNVLTRLVLNPRNINVEVINIGIIIFISYKCFTLQGSYYKEAQ